MGVPGCAAVTTIANFALLVLPVFCRAFSCARAEETNTRVAWFSIFSLAVCVASAVFQLMYLRKFFQRKKLL